MDVIYSIRLVGRNKNEMLITINFTSKDAELPPCFRPPFTAASMRTPAKPSCSTTTRQMILKGILRQRKARTWTSEHGPVSYPKQTTHLLSSLGKWTAQPLASFQAKLAFDGAITSIAAGLSVDTPTSVPVSFRLWNRSGRRRILHSRQSPRIEAQENITLARASAYRPGNVSNIQRKRSKIACSEEPLSCDRTKAGLWASPTAKS